MLVFTPRPTNTALCILDEISDALRFSDKVLLILSKHSIESDWVEEEVSKAFKEEQTRGQTVLFRYVSTTGS